MLTQARLQELVHYDRETGVFTARVNRGPWKIGKRVGGLRSDGYRGLKIDYQDYKEHRLAWLYIYGEWPESDLDHRDNDRAKNRIDHLREASEAQNSWNSKRPNTNRTGFKGVTRNNKNSNRFRARIMCEGRHVTLGTFDSPEQAHAAYVAAAKQMFGEFANAG